MNRRSHVDGFGLAALVAGVLLLIVAFALALVPQPAQAAALVRVTNLATNPLHAVRPNGSVSIGFMPRTPATARPPADSRSTTRGAP